MSVQQRAQEDLQQNLSWITSRRWFGDKARPVTGVSIECADEVEIGDTTLCLTVARFSFEWGEPSRYFIPILVGSRPIEERDATSSPDVLRWLVEGFADQRELRGNGLWRWRTVADQFPDTTSIEYAKSKPISGEQSNTSIVFPGAFIGKLFRRVAPGLNPDLEITEHLTRGGEFTHSPKLYGVLDVVIADDRIDLMAAQEFIENVGDGWSWLLSELAVPSRRERLLEDMRLLGTRTGELHIALANDAGDPEFSPVAIDEVEAQALIRRVISEMEGSVEGLTHHLNPEEMSTLHSGLGEKMGDAWSMRGTLLTRVHGDYHLGQTLRRADGDFEIIDFEGEPSRPMNERRLKLPPLKDVAGMIRSLDYAGATMMQSPEHADERGEIADWVTRATAGYVSAYREAIAASPLPLVPADDDAFESVLNLMIAEKALYETRYEMNNRPDWVWIPLSALKRLVGMEAD